MSASWALPRWDRVGVFATELARRASPGLLGARAIVRRPRARDVGRLDVVLGLGAADPQARAFARRHGIPYWACTPGLVRTAGRTGEREPLLSIVLDDRGDPRDMRTMSRLEALLSSPGNGAGDPLVEPDLLARARAAIERIVSAGLSAHVDTATRDHGLPPSPRPRVLVIDQPRGAASIRLGRASTRTFEEMLAVARDEHPDAEIVVKLHPVCIAGRARGHFDSRTAAGDPRVRILDRPVDPLALVGAVDAVYTVSSQLGFEALLAGKPVVCLGAPFYAGWGLTDDRVHVLRRGRSRTVEQVLAAAYLLSARYADPFHPAREGSLEQVLDHLALQRELHGHNQGRIFCFGFNHWKHNFVRAYLRAPGNRVTFVREVRRAEERGFGSDARILVWGQKATGELRALAARHGVPVWRMEDGFLRSVGLGSNLEAPASLVVDRVGVYYDPTGPSELEQILERGGFSDEELARARALRETIVRERLSKYNVGHRVTIDVPAGKRVVLVPGQVEDDASIRLGCRDVRTNEALLALARERRPDAYIIFKPHPDVVSGNRQGAVPLPRARQLADRVEEAAALPDCLAIADEVHTLTSLVGFEALLRGKEVFVYGQPFYAGWGLTHDRHPVARRTRRLVLDELVAGALLRYPRYLDLRTGRFTTPELIIERLGEDRARSPRARTVKLWGPHRQLRRLVQAVRGMIHAP